MRQALSAQAPLQRPKPLQGTKIQRAWRLIFRQNSHAFTAGLGPSEGTLDSKKIQTSVTPWVEPKSECLSHLVTMHHHNNKTRQE